MTDLFIPQLFGVDELDAYSQTLVDVAGALGVPLQVLDTGEMRGVNLGFLPQQLDWPEIHITRMIVNWRIQVVDAPLSYCAHWCYPAGGLDTFFPVIERLRAWGGDPAGEPTGYTKAHDMRPATYFWGRRPGALLDRSLPNLAAMESYTQEVRKIEYLGS